MNVSVNGIVPTSGEQVGGVGVAEGAGAPAPLCPKCPFVKVVFRFLLFFL